MISTAEQDNKSRVWAILATLAVHALLLVFFIFMVFKTPNPPYPEGPAPGIEVNFGNFIEGTGNVENDQMGDVTDPSPVPQNPMPNTESSPSKAENVVTSEAEESVAINSKPDAKETVKKPDVPVEVVKPNPQPSNELMNALNKFRTRSKNSGGGDGNSGQSGNEGSPDGNPLTDGNGGSGGGPGVGVGNGIRYNLKGRSLVKKPTVFDDSQDQGKVVVEIVVNELGDVVRAEPGARGSTTASPILYAKARQAAFATKFNPSFDGTKEQRGSMTFIFVLD